MAATFVLDELGLDVAQTLIAPSMGGLVSLAFMLRFPDRFERCLIISSAAKAEAHSIAIHSLQREAICNDPKWNNGNYQRKIPLLQGCALREKSACPLIDRPLNGRSASAMDEPRISLTTHLRLSSRLKAISEPLRLGLQIGSMRMRICTYLEPWIGSTLAIMVHPPRMPSEN